MDDRALVERQLGRPPRAFRRVARRCPFGAPAVTEQDPYDSGGEPFPTTYYLTCPHLVAAVARLEAAGGVERWSAAVDEDAELAADLVRATGEQRSLLAGRSHEVGRELGIFVDGCTPALDPARRFEARHRGDQVRAREVVRGRERLAAGVVGVLLGDGGGAERAAASYTAKGAGRPTELTLDERAVIHHARS